MRCWLPFIAIFLIAVPNLAAQQPYFRFDRITTSEGLPSNNTKKIIQDKQGFIWIGTSEGLCRYDGYHVITFTANPAQPHSLVNNYIYDLSEDENGNIWITTAGGWCELLYNTQTFLNANDFKHFSGKQPDFNAEFILADHHQHVIMGGYTGSCLIDLKGAAFEHFQMSKQDTTSLSGLSYMMQDNQGLVWLEFRNGNYVYDPARNNLYNSIYNPYSFPLPKNTTPLLKQGNTVWLGKWGDNLYAFDLRTKALKAVGKDTSGIKELSKNIQPRKMIADKEGNYWLLLVDKGVYFMDFVHNNFQVMANNPGDENSIPSQLVRDILCDRDGNVWIATDKGIARWNNHRQNFEQILDSYQSLQQFIPVTGSNFEINDVLENDGQLWMGVTPIGLIAMNKDKRAACRRIQINTGNRISGMNLLINYILKDKNGDIWVSTQEGYAKYDKRKDNLTPYFIKRNDITGNPYYQVQMMLEDTDGTIWIASKKGLGKLNPVTHDVVWISLPATYKTGLPFYINKIVQQNNSMLWLVTNGGLFSFDKSNGHFSRYASYNLGDSWNPFNDCLDALFVSDTMMMIATQFDGLIQFNPETGKFRIYTVNDGLASNNIRGLFLDKYNGLWITTMNGLSRLNLKTGTFSHYDYSNGLKDLSFPCDQSFYEEKDGNVLLLDGSWLLRFNPARFAGIQNLPALIFTSIEQYDKPVFYAKPISEIKEIQLAYDDRYFTIRFSTLNFENTSRTQYAYRLEGLDTSWHTTNIPTLSYSNLPGGTYTLSVKASLDANTWSSPRQLSILVTPVFWKTWWFCTAVSLVVFTTLVLFYRMRINRLRHKLYLRNKIARDLHDDVGSTLSSLHMVSALAARKITEDPARAKELLEKITESSERMTGNMQDIVWAVNPGNDSFSQIIARMQDFASQTLEAKNIALTFDADDKMKMMKLPLQYRSDLFMLFKEAVNNIAKHSNAGHAWISLNKNNKRILLGIKDDGCGFDTKSKIKGNGLCNMHERAKNLHGNLLVLSGKNGTKITLAFSA